ncbi:MAG: META domain-containing protein [Bacteroidetes bacterium]|nr:MAG: META domain-containing protein [Bacteroidota bacterium]
MKRYMLLWLCAFLCLPAVQAQTTKTSLKDLVGKVWYPIQRQDAGYGFTFNSETEISGSDGCNTFHVKYSYSPRKGFSLGEQVSTRKFCLVQEDDFGVSFLINSKRFVLEGEKLTFYDNAGFEVMTLYSRLIIDTSPQPEKKEKRVIRD